MSSGAFQELKHQIVRAVMNGADERNLALVFHSSECVEHAATLLRLLADGLEDDAFKEKEAARNRYIPAAIRAAVVERDGGECRYCGDPFGPFHIDHVVPVVSGGKPTLDNLCVACATCNQSKGGRTVEEWRAAQDAKE